MKRYVVVFAVFAVVIATVVLGGTSDPNPLTVVMALLYASILTGPPVMVWYAIATSRRRR